MLLLTDVPDPDSFLRCLMSTPVRIGQNIFSHRSSSGSCVGPTGDQPLIPPKHRWAPILLAPAHFQHASSRTARPSDVCSTPGAMTECESVLFASPVGAHDVPPDRWIHRICVLQLFACMHIYAPKRNNSLWIDSPQLTCGSDKQHSLEPEADDFSKVGLFLTVEHCRSAATADRMQSQGRRNPIPIPALEGRYDLEPITGWWGWRWGLGYGNARPLCNMWD